MTNLELKTALRELEARVKLLEGVLQQMADNAALASKPLDPAKLEENVAAAGRAMCPKCGVKPNHYFHVKTCRGQKQEE